MDERTSKVLPSCVCKVQLPHTEDHVKALPSHIMPTVQLEEESAKSGLGQKGRVEEFLKDLESARKQNLEMKRKWEEEAKDLIVTDEEDDDVEKALKDADFEITEETLMKCRLQKSRFLLADARNQLHRLKKEMATHERLARQEVGAGNLYEALTSDKWKGKAEEIKSLKTEIADMEAQAFKHKYEGDLVKAPCFKPMRPDVDDLIPRQQAQVLKEQAKKKKDDKDREDNLLSSMMDEYGNLGLLYKGAQTQNQMLSEELRTLKAQLSKYEEQASDDRELVRTLVVHQLQLQELIDREAHLARIVRDNREKKNTDTSEAVDAMRYYTLWQASRYEASYLQRTVQNLTSRLEVALEAAEEAEKHYEELENLRREAEQSREEEVAEKSKDAKSKTPKKTTKEKLPTAGKHLTTEEQLEVVGAENRFLKDFLLRTIEIKMEDLKLYQFTVNSIKQQYEEAIQRRTQELAQLDSTAV